MARQTGRYRVPKPAGPHPAPAPAKAGSTPHPSHTPPGDRTLASLQWTVGNQATQRQLQAAGPLWMANRAARTEGLMPVAGAVQSRIDARKSGGEPLPATARSEMEAVAGGGLGGVRLHADPESGRLAEALGARAFTQGRDVFFAPGAFNPGSVAGRTLLAHELTHVAEGRAGAGSIQRDRGAPGDIQSYVYKGDPKQATDADFARRSGRDMAARIRQAGQVTADIRLEAQGMLAFFQGAAKEAYGGEILPALRAVEQGPEPEIEMPAEPARLQSYVFAGDKKLATDTDFARRDGRRIAARIPKTGEVPYDIRLELSGMLAFFQGEARDAYKEEVQRAREQHEIEMVPDEDLIAAQDVDDISAWLLDHWYFASRFGIQNASLSEGGQGSLWYLLAIGSNLLWTIAPLVGFPGSLVVKGMALATTLSSHAMDESFQAIQNKDVSTFRDVAVNQLSAAYKSIASQKPALNQALLKLFDKLNLLDRRDPQQTEPRRQAAWEFTFRSGLDYNNPAALENSAKQDVEAIWKFFLPCWKWYTKFENRALTCFLSAFVDSGVADKTSVVTKGFVPGEGKIYRFPSGATVFKRLKPGNFLVSEVSVP